MKIKKLKSRSSIMASFNTNNLKSRSSTMASFNKGIDSVYNGIMQGALIGVYLYNVYKFVTAPKFPSGTPVDPPKEPPIPS